ncbi:hypothetical protein HD806DRAFT_520679 [Xylariaceae sp. AK1471]|nr:hypothetical protein HD806DRAFT_520679 [Xylariaceae sp. AK1471]
MTDSRTQSPPRRQRACLPCTKAKTRCHYNSSEIDDGCDRCRRLRIVCAPQTTRSLRRPRQVKAVEDVNAGDAVVKAGPWETSSIGQVMTSSFISRPPESLLGANGASYTGAIAGSGNSPPQKNYRLPYHSKPLPLQSSTVSHLPPSPGFDITWDEAEHAIEEFTTIFTAHFPFIILDHDVTARRLFVEKPLLFRAILMITVNFTTAKSKEIRRSIDAWIGQHLLVMEDQSLGALQGLIVYCVWANPYFYSDHRATQLIYFAVGLAHNLGITRQAILADTQVREESEINEEQRAFLACYYILSFNSFQFGRPNPLASSYVQCCVDSLERSSEFSTDFLLIKLVKFRLFIERIPTVYEEICDMKRCREVSADASYRLDEMRKYLDDLLSDVAHKNPKFCMTSPFRAMGFLADRDTVLLWTLHQNALLQLHLPMTYVAPDTEETSRLQTECMQHCLEASRAFGRTVKSLSPDGMLYAPFTTLADLFSMLIATSRLLLVDVDSWDLKAARQSIDLKAVLDDMLAKSTAGSKVKAERLAAAAVTNPSSYMPDGPNDEKQDRLRIVTKLIGLIRSWLDSQGASLSEDEDSRQDAAAEPRAFERIHVGPENPQWNFTYFFEFLLQVDRATTLQN